MTEKEIRKDSVEEKDHVPDVRKTLENESNEMVEEIEKIRRWYKDVSEHGLHIEVLYWALSSMKANPNQSIFQAFCDGFNEWIK